MRKVNFDGVQHDPPLSGRERSQVIQRFGGQDDFTSHVITAR